MEKSEVRRCANCGRSHYGLHLWNDNREYCHNCYANLWGATQPPRDPWWLVRTLDGVLIKQSNVNAMIAALDAGKQHTESHKYDG
jgi:hypothetical protein